jgi:hypothetical protein
VNKRASLERSPDAIDESLQEFLPTLRRGELEPSQANDRDFGIDQYSMKELFIVLDMSCFA